MVHLTTEHELAFALTARSSKRTQRGTLTMSTMNNFFRQLMTEMKNEMAKVLAAATTAAKASTGNGGGGTRGGGTGEVGAGGSTECRHGHKYGSNLPLCPHCGKNGKHKTDDCFAIPANAGKKLANFIDGKFVYAKRVE